MKPSIVSLFFRFLLAGASVGLIWWLFGKPRWKRPPENVRSSALGRRSNVLMDVHSSGAPAKMPMVSMVGNIGCDLATIGLLPHLFDDFRQDTPQTGLAVSF
jgi:hypothetical protein